MIHVGTYFQELVENEILYRKKNQLYWNWQNLYQKTLDSLCSFRDSNKKVTISKINIIQEQVTRILKIKEEISNPLPFHYQFTGSSIFNSIISIPHQQIKRHNFDPQYKKFFRKKLGFIQNSINTFKLTLQEFEEWYKNI